jgi:nickel-dependent lactate racemase
LGGEIPARYRVIDHAPRDQDRLVSLGKSRLGVPLWVNRLVAESDLVLATGLVEPHPHAGFSGGGKTVAIGAGGEETISVTHSPSMLDLPGVRVGSYAGNPFQKTVQESAQKAGLDFILNVVLDDEKRIIEIGAGEPKTAHQALVETAEQIYLVPVDGPFDIIIGGVGHPKDANLYQATRVAINMVFGPRPVVKKGGFVIIPARAEEGAGQGVGEERFFEMLGNAESLDAVIEFTRENGCQAGEQAAYIMAHTLKHTRVIIVGAECPETIEQLHMTATPTIEEAFDVAQSALGRQANVAVLPRGLLTLPLVPEEAS